MSDEREQPAAEPPAGEPSAPEPESESAPDSAAAEPAAQPAGGAAGVVAGRPAWRRWVAPTGFSPTGLVVVVLLALLGFTFTVQVRSVAEDPTVAALGQEDLVRILANLDSHEERLRRDIDELQETHRRLTSADESQQEAVAEAGRRADELGILAGTLPVAGPGVVVEFRGGPDAVNAARVLDAVQELRSAGAEAMQVAGADGAVIRVVASTYFLDGEQGLVVDGEPLAAPYRLTVIGEPETLAPALRIPGGVVESVQRDGGTVTVHEEPGGIEVSAVREQATLEHARPDS